jgi:hypothetical protein
VPGVVTDDAATVKVSMRQRRHGVHAGRDSRGGHGSVLVDVTNGAGKVALSMLEDAASEAGVGPRLAQTRTRLACSLVLGDVTIEVDMLGSGERD